MTGTRKRTSSPALQGVPSKVMAFLSSIGALGALDDELRRDLYLFVREEGRPVTRDQAAAHVGISERLAAFHLDKLLEKGLLQAHYARKPGRSGPGAGRSSKYYEVAEAEIAVSIPKRSYDFVGEILVSALAAEEEGRSPTKAAFEIARQRGAQMGKKIRSALRLRRPGRARALACAQDALRDLGFEPHETDDGTVTLRNCPFHRLAQEHPELVCGINQAFIDGLVRGLGNASIEASLEPTPGQCCVKLRSER
jgi:predicted ArsR family transcriptional regulator